MSQGKKRIDDLLPLPEGHAAQDKRPIACPERRHESAIAHTTREKSDDGAVLREHQMAVMESVRRMVA
jgi:hypothetical protein